MTSHAMTICLSWLLVGMALVGHGGLHVALYNRLNATGLSRRMIKRTEWLLLISCCTIPVLLLFFYFRPVVEVLSRRTDWSSLPWGLRLYAMVCWGTWLYPGLPWLVTRPILGFRQAPCQFQRRRLSVDQQLPQSPALSRKCRILSRVPCNQIFELEIVEKDLLVPGLPSQFDGLRIAHLSDIHLTGHISPDFFSYAVQQANHWHPDFMVITGDIVDDDLCIEWLPRCFAEATARLGKYFILGNHDKRVRCPQDIRQTMQQIGWQDVGGRWVSYSAADGVIDWVGNESPWFAAPSDHNPRSTSVLDIALCHSPDCIDWARRQSIPLLLAGHTHGGQGRLPLAGPILSPSRHGSRFASGEFFLAPTTMHVSRGLSGLHLLRLNCPPELPLLTLRSAPLR